MKRNIYVGLLIFTSFLLVNCAEETPDEKKSLSVFLGEPEAVEKAEAMFTAIGGKEKWANIGSLYLKASHEEKGAEGSYDNYTWREFDEFKLKVEQESANFHRIGYFSNAGGWIEYVNEGKAEKVNGPMMRNIYRNHQKNVYTLLNVLATDSNIVVKFNPNGKLDFEQNLVGICSFVLGETNQPRQFITRSMDGLRAEVSVFEQWTESEGYFYPAEVGSIDSSFHFKVEEWKATDQPFTDVKFVYETEEAAGE